MDRRSPAEHDVALPAALFGRREGGRLAIGPAIGPASSALVLAGGVSLGAFEAGTYEALDEAGLGASLDCVAGSSIGGITAAIIAGNAPEDRVARLREFWDAVSSDPTPVTSFLFGPPHRGAWRQAYNFAGVVQTLMLGRPGLFRPRVTLGERAGADDVPALFDLAPLEATLASLVDFDRLNGGAMRVAIAAADVVTGERVVFDTARGDVIGPANVMAACALLPVFAPVQIDGRLLGDGGLACNAPIDIVLGGSARSYTHCFIVDLFALEGSRPHTLAASASRATDLAFGGQSRLQMEGIGRENHLRTLIGRLGALLPPELCGQPEIASILSEGRAQSPEIVYVSYRADLDEAGLGKTFDFSTTSTADRWQAGRQQMRSALERQRGALAPAGHP